MADNNTFAKLGLFFSSRFSILAGKIAPGWANSRIDSLLFIPKAEPDKPVRIPKEFIQRMINTVDGEINSYQTGKGPTVVFVHGWGGSASQFFPLMRGLARCGFTAFAFDHIGHGASTEKSATLHQSILTTNHILNLIKNKSGDGLCAVLGHSTGCITIANSRPALIKDIPLFLISPIFNYKLFFVKKLIKLDLHPDLLKKYAARFSKVYAREYQKLELARNLASYGDVTVIAHDESDSESPISASQKFCQKYPLTKLMVTREYGHNRIINSESVWHELKSHLNYEDTTINFSQTILKNQP
ncbi:MAG: pimeloyl-ACP methyl ester carboxylesterase [Planctomycetota bacterium]